MSLIPGNGEGRSVHTVKFYFTHVRCLLVIEWITSEQHSRHAFKWGLIHRLLSRKFGISSYVSTALDYVLNRLENITLNVVQLHRLRRPIALSLV